MQVKLKNWRPLLAARKNSNDVLAHTFFHLLPAIKHQSHKCLGKALPSYRGVCHSARKWNASQLQTTIERISELISCDETSVQFEMHAGSSEIWIQPPELKSLIFHWNLFGLGFEFGWGLPLRSTPVAQAGKPNCSPSWPHQGGKDNWTPHGSSAVFFWRQAKWT